METEPLSIERLKIIVEESREALMLVEFQTTGTEEKDFFGDNK
jgi:hypothetical protein